MDNDILLLPITVVHDNDILPKGIASVMDNDIWFESNCHCHGQRYLTILIIVVHDNDITHYFDNYFPFQTNFIYIYFQINYFGIKLNLLDLLLLRQGYFRSKMKSYWPTFSKDDFLSRT